MITDLSAFNAGAEWPPPSEKERRERWRDNRKLFQGKHDEIFGQAVEFWHPTLDRLKTYTLNVHKRLSTHWADMMVGEPPAITAGDEAEQNALTDLLAENAITGAITHEVAIDTSRYGVGVYKVRLENGVVRIDAQQPEHWYPVVDRGNVRKVEAHVLAYTFEQTSEGAFGNKRKVEYLFVEIHRRGSVETRVHPLRGKTIGEPLGDASQFGIAVGIVEYDLDDFLVIPVSNLRSTGEVYGNSDYDDIEDIVIGLESRIGQMSKILDKHSEPSAYGPESAITYNNRTGQWEFKKQGYFVLSSDDPTPGYLTWDGKLDAAMNEINMLMEQFYLVGETSPTAFGQQKQGLAESGSALKRLLMADLAKTSRLRNAFDPAVKRVLRVATALAGAPVDVSIDWRDGLPDDPTEMSQNLEREVATGIRSRKNAVRALHPDWTDEQVQAELDDIMNDQASASAMTPSAPPLDLRFDGGTPAEDA